MAGSEAIGAGTATVTITAEDTEGLTAEQDFGVTVTEGGSENRPPVAVGTVPAQNLAEDETVTLDASAYFTDPDNDALEFTSESSNSGVATVTVSNAQLELEAVGAGTTTVTITAEDIEGLTAEQEFDVTVTEGGGENRPPVAVGTVFAQSLTEDDTETLDASAYFTDPDNDVLEFTAESSNSGVATVTVSNAQLELEAIGAGTATVTITAEDTGGLTAEQDFAVTVFSSTNQPPVAVGTMPDVTMALNDTVQIEDVYDYFEDPEGDSLTHWSLWVTDPWNPSEISLSLSGSTMTIVMTQIGAGIKFYWHAVDALGRQAFQTFSITPETSGSDFSMVGVLLRCDWNRAEADLSATIGQEWRTNPHSRP